MIITPIQNADYVSKSYYDKTLQRAIVNKVNNNAQYGSKINFKGPKEVAAAKWIVREHVGIAAGTAAVAAQAP